MAVPLGPTIKSILLEIKLIDLLMGQILVQSNSGSCQINHVWNI